MDIIDNREFFISKEKTVTFDDELSNTYIYYSQNKVFDKEIIISGDLSKNDIILSKIVFEEILNEKVNISVSKETKFDLSKNIVLVGEDNFLKSDFKKGISLELQIIDILELPYVNFSFASLNKESIKKMD